MTGFFITGTDTGVGKTTVSVQLIQQLKQHGVTTVGFKPVASGAERLAEGLRNEDALLLSRASSVAMDYEEVNPFCFEPAIAPHLAAARCHQQVSVTAIQRAYQTVENKADCVVVEGAGGWAVPLNASESFADLPSVLDLPVILVVGMKLGCINHAVLTEMAIRQAGCRFIGWIANEIDPHFAELEENVETLKNQLTTPFMGMMNHKSFNKKETNVNALDLRLALDCLR